MKNVIAIIVSFILVSTSFAQETPKKEDLTNYALSTNKVSQEKKIEKDAKENFHRNISAGNEKSPVLGGVLSALVPGAGELYSKSYVKAAIFLAVEAGMWIGYATFQNKGNTQTDSYQAFADANWSVRQYAQWVHDKITGGASINPNEPDLNVLRSQLNAVEATAFSHQLPVYGSQQYYELIGKYQNFVTGWKDADYNNISGAVVYTDPNSYVNVKTGMFNSYSYDRQKANDYFDTSTRFITGVIVNHVLSAADAVWSVHIFNNNLKVKTGMRIEERFGGILMEKYSLPTANISVQF